MPTRFPSEVERKKRSLIQELLQGGLVTLQLDARLEGVDVPPAHKSEMALVLNLSERFNLRVFDLGPLSITASLSFSGEAYECVLPYSAIYSVVSQAEGKHFLFAESLPEEIAVKVSGEALPNADSRDEDEPGPEPSSPGPHLRLIK